MRCNEVPGTYLFQTVGRSITNTCVGTCKVLPVVLLPAATMLLINSLSHCTDALASSPWHFWSLPEPNPLTSLSSLMLLAACFCVYHSLYHTCAFTCFAVSVYAYMSLIHIPCSQPPVEQNSHSLHLATSGTNTVHTQVLRIICPVIGSEVWIPQETGPVNKSPVVAASGS